jgi:4-hydroxy-3-methylbut-2-enyl diphosphate reductase
MELATAAVADGNPVYTLGPLLHNPDALKSLKQMKIKIASGVLDIPAGATVVLRAHGVAPGEIETLRSASAKIVHAVCPFVAGIHKKIRALNQRGAVVFIAGDAAHSETATHLSVCANKGGVFASAAEARHAEPTNGRPAALIAQTSFDRAEFAEIASALSSRIPEIEIHDTLCDWMRKARESAAKVAVETGRMIVVGGRASANTARLLDVCVSAGARAFLVETAEEILPAHVAGALSIGVTAGASTPQESIDRVVGKLESVAEGI